MSDDDDVIRKRILTRFTNIFEHGKPQTIKADIGEKRGRSRFEMGGKGWWHQLVISYVEKREQEGISRNEACRDFQKILSEKHKLNLAEETVMDVVRSFHGRFLYDEAEWRFPEAILDNDLDAAVNWFKKLRSEQKKKWGLD